MFSWLYAEFFSTATDCVKDLACPGLLGQYTSYRERFIDAVSSVVFPEQDFRYEKFPVICMELFIGPEKIIGYAG